MGNIFAYHRRHYVYWGAVLLLMIPSPTGVYGWNIPYFGGPSASSPKTIDNVVSDGNTSPMPSLSQDNINIPLLSTVTAPLIGPVDAPHLRYIPSYFSGRVPDKIKQLVPKFLSTFHATRLKIYHLLWYKPPVGIVGAYSLLRVLEKVYGVFSPPPPSSSDEVLADAEGRIRSGIRSLINLPGTISTASSNGVSLSPWGSIGQIYTANIQSQKIKKRRRKRKAKVRKGRSFDLDSGDRSYSNFGGVDTVRVRACQEGLRAALSVTGQAEESTSLDDDTDNEKNNARRGLFGLKHMDEQYDNDMKEYTKDMETALAALQLSCPPKGSREYFIEQSADSLSVLSKYLPPNGDTTASNNKKNAPSVQEQNIHLLLRYSSKLIELRVLDALLRTLRDRHLIVAARLRRTREYWKWHVNISGGWLGRLANTIRQQLMLIVPTEWMGVIDYRDVNQREFELATATWEREIEMLGKAEQLLLERPEEIEASNLLKVMGDKQQVSWWNTLVNRGNGDANNTGGESSKLSMSQTIRLLLQSKNRIWLKQTERWTRQAREAIEYSLDETIRSSFESSSHAEEDELEEVSDLLYAESSFLKKWTIYDESTSGASSWINVLEMVDYAASSKRPGERRQFQLSSITDSIKRFDVLGIPSSALLLASANYLHDKFIAPNKQEIIDFVKSIHTAIWGIVEFRFYTPMKDIFLDLLNRRPRMVDPFAYLNEQTSLDNMLLDLGVGDGTIASRPAALAAASRMYEQEVSGGAIRGLLRGKVAQLMLIQIQQLKTDLLQAMDTIDSLVDANRLNVQLVASVPAVLILIYGTRALYLFWSSIRMKDFKLPHDVHAEMSDYLKKVEECLVLSNYQLDASSSKTIDVSSEVSITKTDACLRPKEMGKLLLLLHSYLNMLDYMSPPFPSKTCDSIHRSIQNLLLQGQMSTARQLELLKVIQSKHNDLLKSL